jgi:Mg2+ and Co2+ transporter CorA
MPTPQAARIFHLQGGQVTESAGWLHQAPETGFVWIALSRACLEAELSAVQVCVQQLTGHALVDLHVQDLLNAQLPSRFEDTSRYDLLVFRRLASRARPAEASADEVPRKVRGPAILRRIDTSPVGFAVFDRLLLTVHPSDCSVREAFAARLLASVAQAERVNGAKLPVSPADLMLRLVNQMVDQYLDLRRELNRQLDHWQSELLNPGSRFSNWNAVLEARVTLHRLDELCEDQRSALQDWLDALETWPEGANPGEQREHELLKVRSRDVLEHIERVVHHVRRLERSTEVAVQLHFSAQSHRTNEIMRTLTALTAVFLPLNLITGFFGMNFEFMPLVHTLTGFWWVVGLMAGVLVLVLGWFWRRRYLAHR